MNRSAYSIDVIALRGRDQKAYKEINDVKNLSYSKSQYIRKNKTGQYQCNYKNLRQGNIYLRICPGECLFHNCIFFSQFVKHGFDVIHTHNPSDILSMIGIFYKLLGKKYVFDHHDLSPELYLTRISGKRDLIYLGLIFFERLSCRFSDIIIIANESYKQIEITRYSVDPDKIYIIRNNPIISDCILSNEGNDHAKSPNQKNNVAVSWNYKPAGWC